MSFLQVEQCGIRFGGLTALQPLNFSLQAGELLGIIGPNGAGKTTLFNLLTGVYAPSFGQIVFDGKRLNALRPHQIACLGMARTFQNIRLFENLSVLDNIRIAFHRHLHYSHGAAILRTPQFQREEKKAFEQCRQLLQIFDLSPCQNEKAKNLSYGNQRRLEIARAIATRPKLLLLDEPAAGMNATEKKQLVELLQKLQQDLGLAMILIEHDMKVVMSFCPRLIVLDYGEKIAEGSPEAIRSNPKVIEAYLGESR